VPAQFVDIHGAAEAKAVPVEHYKYEIVIREGAGFSAFAPPCNDIAVTRVSESRGPL